MNKVDRWLLPDGIEEILPAEASQTEGLRRKFINLFQSWGYDYVIPPMVEFTDSLLTGSGQDIDLLTFKVTDQLSGKTMGIRADITPQAARMDAHSLKRDGVNRLCYAGHVMHTKPKAPLTSRTPIKVGVELFGEAGIDADIEIVSLLLETLIAADIDKQYIDIGHVGVYRALAKAAQLSELQEESLFSLLQTKSVTEIHAWVESNVRDEVCRQWLCALPKLSGGLDVLEQAKESFSNAPSAVLEALEELQTLTRVIAKRYPEAQLYCDLSELRGYHYHTGIVFGAFAPGLGNAIASGGRYDHIGEAFGSARPATGFDADLTAISRLVCGQAPVVLGVFAPSVDSDKLWAEVKNLREKGERVVCGLSGQTLPSEEQLCDRILRESAPGVFVLETIG